MAMRLHHFTRLHAAALAFGADEVLGLGRGGVAEGLVELHDWSARRGRRARSFAGPLAGGIDCLPANALTILMRCVNGLVATSH